MSTERVRVFVSPMLQKGLPEEAVKDLVSDFRQYKETGKLPDTFGRDVPYTFSHHRSYLELQHLHTKLGGEPFPARMVQFYRTSDRVLVYSPGFTNPSAYLLIAIIKHWDYQNPDDIDGTDKDPFLMSRMEKASEAFRNKY